MTPVEEIRRAAALIRERAGKATPSPWVLDGNSIYHGHPIEEVVEWPYDDNAEHIASWHPAVALAVADWLDLVAKLLSQGFDSNAETKAALAVARAYLGDQP